MENKGGDTEKKKGRKAAKAAAGILVIGIAFMAGMVTDRFITSVKDIEPVSSAASEPQESLPPQESSAESSMPESTEPESSMPESDPESTESSTESSSPASEDTAAPPAGIKTADEMLSDMTLEEKLCQLFMIFPESITGQTDTTGGGERVKEAFLQRPVGGIILEASNMQSQEQVSDMIADMQVYSKLPLLISCDEEGGRVNRLMDSVGTTYIGPMLEYQDQGTDVAWSNADTIALDMKGLGFNMDMAPVADIMSNPDNTVIGDRAYSTDFNQGAQLVAAAVEGFHDGGIICTLKHFPGHGDTSADSHDGAVYIYKTLDELRAGELIPFKAGIDAGADAVMVGHLNVEAIDSLPVPFSYNAVTGLLREEMGFDGIVITDALRMDAISDSYTSGEAAVMAVQAGVDILLCPEDFEDALNGLKQAISSGGISEDRVDESVLRILELKLEYGLFKAIEN